jgi:hypothetical protein
MWLDRVSTSAKLRSLGGGACSCDIVTLTNITITIYCHITNTCGDWDMMLVIYTLPPWSDAHPILGGGVSDTTPPHHAS